ncbi:phytanoyl-CoA dioxygenase family protein [Pseudanabaena sp. PCC 6802]|uniref:phytanoyl-CoA dioxygenase family protein n=1 Tax=Pseudanabaena sp. PCC 6802 TaxID=118173 RepID=UPI000347B708|nr:phytanoyl-CoA dioxygenase family protein [Pseudanabaena sp. PCC 6802]
MENIIKTALARYVRLIKQGITDYRWLLFYIQRIDYNPERRRFISSIIANLLPKTIGHQLSPEAQKLNKTLDEDGVVVLNNFVDKTQVEEMRAYLATKLCLDPQRPEMGRFSSPDLAPKVTFHAYYTNEDAASLPHLWELANDPTILSIIEERFGAKPTISFLAVWWKLNDFDPEANANLRSFAKPEEFHRDVDDWSEIKLFIYLNDVDESTGPHGFIKSSHKWFLPPRSRALDLDCSNFPMKDNLAKITGEAGMAWLENSYVLHRGMVVTARPRLIISVVYTLFPGPHSPKTPILTCPDRNRFDPYINRVYLRDSNPQ